MQVHGVFVTVIVMHRMLRGEMKTDEGGHGNGLESYLQYSDYLFLQLKRQGQNFKRAVIKEEWQRVQSHLWSDSKYPFFLSHEGLFLSDFKEIFLFLLAQCPTAYIHFLNCVPTLD